MLIFKKRVKLRRYLLNQKKSGLTIGFFPTMGALHEGHISLLHECRQHCDIAVASIFVNPTQFNNPADLQKYPRTEAEDISILEKEGCDVLFLPESDEVYMNEKPWQPDLKGLGDLLEGEFRPGHFDGVARVVKILFEIVEPDKAFFGLKDYQQCLVIKRMVESSGIPVDLYFADTKRERSGLAKSSRNRRLSPEETKSAGIIYQALLMAKENAGRKSVDEVKQECRSMIESAAGHRVDYFEIADPETLRPLTDWNGAAIALTAVYVGEVRLIDNLFLKNR